MLGMEPDLDSGLELEPGGGAQRRAGAQEVAPGALLQLGGRAARGSSGAIAARPDSSAKKRGGEYARLESDEPPISPVDLTLGVHRELVETQRSISEMERELSQMRQEVIQKQDAVAAVAASHTLAAAPAPEPALEPEPEPEPEYGELTKDSKRKIQAMCTTKGNKPAIGKLIRILNELPAE